MHPAMHPAAAPPCFWLSLALFPPACNSPNPTPQPRPPPYSSVVYLPTEIHSLFVQKRPSNSHCAVALSVHVEK